MNRNRFSELWCGKDTTNGENIWWQQAMPECLVSIRKAKIEIIWCYYTNVLMFSLCALLFFHLFLPTYCPHVLARCTNIHSHVLTTYIHTVRFELVFTQSQSCSKNDPNEGKKNVYIFKRVHGRVCKSAWNWACEHQQTLTFFSLSLCIFPMPFSYCARHITISNFVYRVETHIHTRK